MKRILLISGLLLLFAAPAAMAQELKTAAFLDNYIFSYKINPGSPIKGRPYSFYAAGLGNLSFSAQTDFRLPYFNFDWFRNGWTGMDFLANFSQGNTILPQASVNLCSFGRQGERGRFAFEWNVRSDNAIYAPVDFFSEFNFDIDQLTGWRIPSGMCGFRNISFKATDYMEFLFSYSHKIGDFLTIGGNVKFLLGMFGLGFDLYDLNARVLDETDVQFDVNADIFLSSSLVKVGTVQRNGYEVYDFTKISFGRTGFTGRGLGLDLGFTLVPMEGLTLGASVLDLGFIRWNESINGSIRYTERIVNYGANLFELEVADRSTLARRLNYNIHLSANYQMPFYSGLSLGVLTTFQEYFRECRVGLALSPLSFISVAGSVAANNFGTDLGAAVNMRIPGVNIFVGLDTLLLEQNMTNASAGVQIAF